MPADRVEHDSMGEVRVPGDALWGAQTQRAVENFPISGRPIPAEVIHALALIKAESARVNKVDKTIADAAEVPKASFYSHFDTKEAFGAEVPRPPRSRPSPQLALVSMKEWPR